MAKTLSCKIIVTDNFTTQLNKLSKSLTEIDGKFDKLGSTLDKSVNKISNGLDKLVTKMDKVGTSTSKNFSRVTSTLESQFTNVEKKQEKTIDNIEKRYQKMVQNVNKDLKDIKVPNTESNKSNSNNSNVNKTNNSDTSSFGLDNILKNVFSGNFGSIIGKLGIIGAGITAVTSAVKIVDTTMNSGFDMLNKTTGNLFSTEGIQESLQDAMGFETGRQKLDLFYGKDQGAYEYGVATKLANSTYASEQDTIDIISKLGQVGINVNEDQLRNLLDVAGTRPSVGTEHIGLAMQEAVDGRVAMLKLYGINNAKLQDFYKDIKKSDPQQYKELKGALNSKGTAGDAQKYFNLVNAFIDQSPMNDYAETYVQTLQGKLERLTGLFSKSRAEIMGIETDSGIARTGSLFDELGKAVDKLKDKLEQPQTIEFMKKIGDAFGSVAGGLSEGFMKLIDGVDLNKVVESINKVSTIVCESLKKMIDSGVLDELIEKLPKIIERILGFKSAELETKMKLSTDAQEGKWGKYGIDWLDGQASKYISQDSWTAIDRSVEEAQKGNFSEVDNQYESYLGLLGLKDFFGINKNDSDVISLVNKNSYLNSTEKEQVKSYIKNDEASSYSIDTVIVQNATDMKQLLDEIRRSASNRK